MIIKTLAVTLCLFGIHYVFAMSNPEIGIATHQGQDNVVKAEEYIYSPADTVVLGTSLAGRILYRDSLPTIQSIAFGGSSPECGLTILSRMERKPKVALIETNLLTRESDLGFVDDVTDPWRMKMNTLLPNLRERNKPICELFGWLLKMSGMNMYASAINVPRELLESRMADMRKNWSEFDSKEYKARLEEIATMVNNIEKDGVKVMFFEMPINPEMQAMPEYKEAQRLVRERFPMAKYDYLANDTTEYETTDGEHLSYTEQCRYTAFFKRAMGK